MSSITEILGKYERLLDTRKNRSGADPFVIALAVVERCAVLTEEGQSGTLAKPNIPDVCADMGIRCIDMVGLIREQRWVFRM